LKDWINFGIYWKNLLSHSRLGLGLDTSGVVNIPESVTKVGYSRRVNFRARITLVSHYENRNQSFTHQSITRSTQRLCTRYRTACVLT